ncbi:MAG: magnesium transporter [Candidatus Woesearchaeota archaeon]|nr:MAG: magnesium transporter [Candidatus Woesearchaeota archaeon]
MELAKKILRESLPILIIAAFGAIIAGIIVKDISIYMNILPGILILAPAIMSMTGSILGMFNSRITSAVHDGEVRVDSFKNPILKENIIALIVIILIISIVLGILAHFFCIWLGYQSLGILTFVMVVLLTNALSYFFMVLISLLVIFLSIKKKKDPDDIIFPIATVATDIGSMFFLLLIIKVIVVLLK